jgi:ferrous iron transport protein B
VTQTRRPDGGRGPAKSSAQDAPLVVAIAGAPNAGKSTLFNALSGAGARTGNWPGTSVAVERSVWRPATVGPKMTHLRSAVPTLQLVDLPGAYSLNPLSGEEQVSADALLGERPPDVIVAVVDAAHLARSLYLVAQLRELPVRVVVAMTMIDVAESRGIVVDVDALARAVGAPVVPIDPRHRCGMGELAVEVWEAIRHDPPRPRAYQTAVEAVADDDPWARDDERFAWIELAVAASVREANPGQATWSDKVDRWVLAPVVGPLIFLAAMWLILQVTTTVAAPLQEWLGDLFTNNVANWARSLLETVGLGGGWLDGLLVDGLIAGVGMVLSFVPLMAIMFVLLALLEDSGYLARAAVVADSTMRRIGLPGQAFLPLIVGFGCNVPAIASTRILPKRSSRVMTALLVPLTSCTARLTVYLLICSTFFGRWAGTVVFAMYVISVLLVVVIGLVLRRTVWRVMPDQPMVLDLPPYQHPTVRLVAAVTWQRLKGFLQTAAGIIVGVVVVVWLLQAIPTRAGVGGFGDVDVANSVFAAISRFIAPLFTWAGFADWRLVSALVVGLAAKEAVVSSWAQTFQVAEASNTVGLVDPLRQAFAGAAGGHELLAVAAFLVFLLAYTPCAATLAAQVREIGVKWTVFGLAAQFVVAWVLAVVVYQVGGLIVGVVT